MGARAKISDVTGISSKDRCPGVAAWVEVWDYAGDASFRGFTTAGTHETMFIFLQEPAMGNDLKHG